MAILQLLNPSLILEDLGSNAAASIRRTTSTPSVPCTESSLPALRVPQNWTSQKECQELVTQNLPLTPSNASQPERFQVSQDPTLFSLGGVEPRHRPPPCAVTERWKHSNPSASHRSSHMSIQFNRPLPGMPPLLQSGTILIPEDNLSSDEWPWGGNFRMGYQTSKLPPPQFPSPRLLSLSWLFFPSSHGKFQVTKSLRIVFKLLFQVIKINLIDWKYTSSKRTFWPFIQMFY